MIADSGIDGLITWPAMNILAPSLIQFNSNPQNILWFIRDHPIISSISRNSVLQHCWLFQLQLQFSDFLPKLCQLVDSRVNFDLQQKIKMGSDIYSGRARGCSGCNCTPNFHKNAIKSEFLQFWGVLHP